MLRKIFIIFSLLSTLIANTSQASVIFTFTIDDLGDSNFNATLGDTFTFSFLDDDNFDTGITGDDIESIAFSSQAIGEAEFQSEICGSQCINDLNQIFNFTDLGQGIWQLDLMVGNTGIDAAIVLGETAGFPGIQLAQEDGLSGLTSFALQTSFETSSGFQSIHFSDDAYVFSATSISVPEPSTFGAFLISALVLFIGRKKLVVQLSKNVINP